MFALLESVWNLLQNLCNTIRLTLGMLLHYLGKLKILIFCRYSTIIPDMEENANKLHFKCADFNSSTRVTVYVECIYVFLSKSCLRRWIPCWSLTSTAVTSAAMNFWPTNLSQKWTSKRTLTWKILFATSMAKNSLYWTPKVLKFVDQ